MSDLKEYKCPCCGGAIEFNAAGQNMYCPFCGTEFDIATLQSFEAELQQEAGGDNMHWATTGGTGWYQGEQESLRRYTCNSCGGEVVADGTTAATECPFCGNPVMVPGQLSGALRPNFLVPFRVDKEGAKAALRNHYKGKLLLPKVFKDENHINEIKGIYVPFWLYDTDTQASVRYKATTVRTWSDSDYNYTETCYFAVRRGGFVGFEKVPVDGSTKMEDDLMESIEPFNIQDSVPFHTAYLSGFLADKYDVDSATSIARANERIRASVIRACREAVIGYDSLEEVGNRVDLKHGRAKNVMMPVWMLNTRYKDKTYTFCMNGQTGRIVGNLPVDKTKALLLAGGVFAGTMAVVFAVLQFLL